MKRTFTFLAAVALVADCVTNQCMGFSITYPTRYPTRNKCRIQVPGLRGTPSSELPLSVIPPSNQWGNIAALSFAASLAQLLGKTTTIGRLLGAPVTAMALTFVLSSLNIVPPTKSGSSWLTILPSGGSPASAFLQTTSLTLATPLLLLGVSLRGGALKKCGSLLGSFLVASFGTLIGAIAAVIPSLSNILPSMMHSLPNGDGLKIAAALLAKNIGGGINYMTVCSCLGAAPESVAAGLCVDNVMALFYFPLTSMLASNFDDLDDGDIKVGRHSQQEDKDINQIESCSHAFTSAAILTALGQYLNSMLSSSTLNLSLPITTLLTVLFSTYYPSDWFLSPTHTSPLQTNNSGNRNSIAKAGEFLGTSLLYLFFASAGAPGWRIQDSIQQSFRSIATFLIIMYGVHLGVLWGFQRIVISCTSRDTTNTSIWKKIAAPQRLLAGSSAAIGGPATAVALAQTNEWTSLLTPSLLVGNIGYAIATFIALIYYSAFRLIWR